MKLARKLLLAASAPTTDSTAVTPIVITRIETVGRTRRNESMPLINVSDPPYMFRAMTETSPSADRMRTTVPKPVKTLSPAALIEVIVSNFSPAHAASNAPSTISQPPPSAEPQYVQ